MAGAQAKAMADERRAIVVQHLREHGPRSSLELQSIVRDSASSIVHLLRRARERGEVLVRLVRTRRQRTGVSLFGLPEHTEAQWVAAAERASHAGRHTAGAMFYPVRRPSSAASIPAGGAVAS